MEPIHEPLITPIEYRIDDTLDAVVQQLRLSPEIDIAATRLEAEILLAYCLDRPRSYLRAWPEKGVTDDERQRLMLLLERRLNGEPIAYIIGRREFWDISLRVTQDTLIPRPETELLVEQTLKLLKPHHTHRVADLGTGCGAIALCIAKHRPGCVVTAIDNSAAALAIAKENAATLELQNVDFLQSHWLENIGNRRFHLIVANPPYIADNDIHLQQGDLRFEPRAALSSGADGLRDLRIIIRTAPKALLTGGWLLVEHGYQQGPAVKKLFLERGFQQIQGYTDIEKRDRVTSGQWNSAAMPSSPSDFFGASSPSDFIGPSSPSDFIGPSSPSDFIGDPASTTAQKLDSRSEAFRE